MPLAQQFDTPPRAFFGHILGAVIRYIVSMFSGPLLDRIDLHIEVPPVKFREIAGDRIGETSAQIRDRVVAARQRRQERFRDNPKITCNAGMHELMITCCFR